MDPNWKHIPRENKYDEEKRKLPQVPNLENLYETSSSNSYYPHPPFFYK